LPVGSIITITTDFGIADGYQAVLEGVIGGICASARTVVISHQVEPGNILGGWYLLKTHHRYFPQGTVHLAVIDPGVGTRRKILLVTTKRYFFIAPDNGLLSFLPPDEVVSIRSVTNRDYALSSVSPVFHGRDIMAPAAAYVSLGIDPSCLGPACRKMTRLEQAEPVRRGRKLSGRVVWVDRFGNLITNIAEDVFRSGTVSINGQPVGPIRRSFADVRPGRPLAYIGSGGHLEIAVRDGSARHYFHAAVSAEVEIEVASK
jgi:S-adenosylmethionine hydrolase